MPFSVYRKMSNFVSQLQGIADLPFGINVKTQEKMRVANKISNPLNTGYFWLENDGYLGCSSKSKLAYEVLISKGVREHDIVFELFRITWGDIFTNESYNAISSILSVLSVDLIRIKEPLLNEVNFNLVKELLDPEFFIEQSFNYNTIHSRINLLGDILELSLDSTLVNILYLKNFEAKGNIHRAYKSNWLKIRGQMFHSLKNKNANTPLEFYFVLNQIFKQARSNAEEKIED